MKAQKIFRIGGFGNLSAIATVTNDNKCWVRYYDGTEVIESIYTSGIQSKFVLAVEVDIINWCKSNDYHLWSY